MVYTVYDSAGNVFASGNTGGGGGGAGTAWFIKEGGFWTSNSTFLRYPFSTPLHNKQSGVSDELDMAWAAPFNGVMRQIIVIQNGTTSSTGNVIIKRAPAAPQGQSLVFSDVVTLTNFIQVVDGFQTCKMDYTMANGLAFAAGDTIKADIQYNGSGVNQSSTIQLLFACPGVA